MTLRSLLSGPKQGLPDEIISAALAHALGVDPATPDLHGGAQGSSFGEVVGAEKMLEGEQAAEEAVAQKSYQASHFNLGLPLSPEFGALALAAEPNEAHR